MKVERYGKDSKPVVNSVVTVGTFDGVHLGHEHILREVAGRATEIGGVSTVVTFDPHPREVVSGDAVPLLTTVEERIERMDELGIKRVVIAEFDRAFASMSAEDFVRDVLHRDVGMSEIVVGYDHGFGRGRSGDRELLADQALELGFQVYEIPAKTNRGTAISSSTIRELLLRAGDVESAARMLGRLYTLSGLVVPGDGRGRLIGFPTANINIGSARKIVPLRGVYAVRIRLSGSTRRHGGMLNIGFRPTFDGTGMRVEAHIFDFDEDIYGSGIQIEFVKRVRDEQKFVGLDALREQLSEDRVRCMDALGSVT